jgi:hypothetical protein
MSSAVLDERKIDSLVSSYQDTERLIYAGSDEHLDIILTLQQSVKHLIKLSVAVNEELEATFNSMSQDQAKSIVIKLTGGLNTAKQLIAVLRNCHPSIADGIKSCRKELYLETKQIDEFVQDIIRYKIENPQELKDIMNEIK